MDCSCCLTSLVCSGSHSYVCQPRLTTIQRLAWVQLRARGHILQYLSCWCSAGSVIERQEVVGAGSASTLQRIVFFGRVMNLQLHIFRLPVWISHLHGGTFLVCLDFHCGQHKGLWDGMWEQGGCAACFGVCLTASVSGWCRFVHEVNGHPLPNSESHGGESSGMQSSFKWEVSITCNPSVVTLSPQCLKQLKNKTLAVAVTENNQESP